jgi:predicted TPR repeat methyltransferase
MADEFDKLRGTRQFQPRDKSPEAMEKFFAEAEDPWGYKRNPDHLGRAGEILDILKPRKFKRMLDVGCAEGFITHLIRAAADYRLGIDPSPTAIQRAREEFSAEIDFAVGNLLTFRSDQPFDLVTITGVLYYVKEKIEQVYATLDALLEPGGVLLLSHLKESSGDGFLRLFDGNGYSLSRSREYTCNNAIHLMHVFTKD